MALDPPSGGRVLFDRVYFGPEQRIEQAWRDRKTDLKSAILTLCPAAKEHDVNHLMACVEACFTVALKTTAGDQID